MGGSFAFSGLLGGMGQLPNFGVGRVKLFDSPLVAP